MILKIKKNNLRKKVFENKKNLSQEAIAIKSHTISLKLLNLNVYQQAKNIMLYIATKTEVQTKQIIYSAQKDHKNVYIPLIDSDNKTLKPSLVYDFNKELTIGCCGIFQPKQEFYRICAASVLDLIILPGIAFDPKGYRLGRGGGYYDRFLGQIKQTIPTIALAFAMQLFKEIPYNDQDIPVNCIITEEKVYFNAVNQINH